MHPVVRVERGRAEPEEVAALTAVLLARTAAAAEPGPGHRPGSAKAGWRRPERPRGYRPPHSWQG
ncbi:acyl-CoA carboxylase subunit epsilon [Streptomyces bluensis]|uniref:acyl-CoA carboxylase subunit epsilon n=1 Tax=Streptomyces bluensis TaxID=33897 RepID=UPI003332F8FA